MTGKAKPREPFDDATLLKHGVSSWTSLTFEERVRLRDLRSKRYREKQMRLRDGKTDKHNPPPPDYTP
jgi:hypothetical protein